MDNPPHVQCSHLGADQITMDAGFRLLAQRLVVHAPHVSFVMPFLLAFQLVVSPHHAVLWALGDTAMMRRTVPSSELAVHNRAGVAFAHQCRRQRHRLHRLPAMRHSTLPL